MAFFAKGGSGIGGVLSLAACFQCTDCASAMFMLQVNYYHKYYANLFAEVIYEYA